jgi:hypothetical protein
MREERVGAGATGTNLSPKLPIATSLSEVVKSAFAI